MVKEFPVIFMLLMYFYCFFLYRSRKRRPSSGNLFQSLVTVNSGVGSGGDDVMDECAAAMVLMSLSCSPHSPHWDNGKKKIFWYISASNASYCSLYTCYAYQLTPFCCVQCFGVSCLFQLLICHLCWWCGVLLIEYLFKRSPCFFQKVTWN